MKKTLFIAAAAIFLLSGCQKKTDDEAAARELLSEIEKLYEQGQYRTALDSIESLRMRFPMSVEGRRKGLRLWQEASLKMAQESIVASTSAICWV